MNNKHKIEWKFKREIAECLMTCGFTIYGGFVRDYILHDSNAIDYYKKKDMEENSKLGNDISSSCCYFLPEDIDNFLYQNKDFIKETADRTVIPKDIDCYGEKSSFYKFINIIKAKKFEFEIVYRRDPSKYLEGLILEEGTTKQVMLKVSMINHKKISKIKNIIYSNLSKIAHTNELDITINGLNDSLNNLVTTMPYVYVEMIYSLNPGNSYQPPFGKLDFECNGLLLENRDIRLSRDLNLSINIKSINKYDDPFTRHIYVNKVIDDIMNRKAYLCRSDIDLQRIQKFYDRGWSICGKNIIKTVEDENYNGHCIICHDKMGNGNHYKLYCCDARYHRNCLVQSLKRDIVSCAMCRQNLSTDISIDYLLIKEEFI